MVIGEQALDEYIIISDTGSRNEKISLMCLFTFIYFSRYSLLSFARSFSVSTALVGGLTLLLFAVSLILYTAGGLDHISFDGIVLIACAWLFFAVTLRLHPEYQARFADVLHEGRFGAKAVFTYGAGIYTYYLVRLFRQDGRKLYRVFRVIAYVILLFDIWSMFFNRTEEYKMGFGYQMEMAAILFLCMYFYEDRNRWKLILSLFCILAGVLYGSRACIIGYAVFVVLYFIWDTEFDARQFYVMALAILAILVSTSQPVMQMIYYFFSSLGLHSRTLYYVAGGDILAVDTARQDKIWPVLWENLKGLPFFKMLGAYGDRYLLQSKWPYAHNFVLEILLTFGKFLGGLFLIWMLVQFVKVILYHKDENGLLTIAFGSFALCRLMFSSSFWQEPYFWAFLAMLVNCGLQRRRYGRSRRNALPDEDEIRVPKEPA